MSPLKECLCLSISACSMFLSANSWHIFLPGPTLDVIWRKVLEHYHTFGEIFDYRAFIFYIRIQHNEQRRIFRIFYFWISWQNIGIYYKLINQTFDMNYFPNKLLFWFFFVLSGRYDTTKTNNINNKYVQEKGKQVNNYQKNSHNNI